MNGMTNNINGLQLSNGQLQEQLNEEKVRRYDLEKQLLELNSDLGRTRTKLMYIPVAIMQKYTEESFIRHCSKAVPVIVISKLCDTN